jgi:hypothetical protein
VFRRRPGDVQLDVHLDSLAFYQCGLILMLHEMSSLSLLDGDFLWPQT